MKSSRLELVKQKGPKRRRQAWTWLVRGANGRVLTVGLDFHARRREALRSAKRAHQRLGEALQNVVDVRATA